MQDGDDATNRVIGAVHASNQRVDSGRRREPRARVATCLRGWRARRIWNVEKFNGDGVGVRGFREQQTWTAGVASRDPDYYVIY